MSANALSLLRTMLRMRRLEEQVIHLAQDHQGLIRGHYHVYIGQEAAGAGACAALRPSDYVFTTHRNHGHIVAKGGDPGRILAEIIGRADGYCLGRGGTFHVAAPEIGVLHTSAIVAGCLPLAAGAAYAAKELAEDRATVVFFGDGAMEEGAFYETLNIAQLWQLPLILFMENNGGLTSSSHSASALSDVPRAFNVDTLQVDGTDPEAVYELVASLRGRAGPVFIESRTVRWPGNAGAFPRLIGGETQLGWLWGPMPESLRGWADPVLTFARKVLDRGAATREALQAMDTQVRQEIAAAAEFALASPLPAAEAALEHAYA